MPCEPPAPRPNLGWTSLPNGSVHPRGKGTRVQRGEQTSAHLIKSYSSKPNSLLYSVSDYSRQDKLNRRPALWILKCSLTLLRGISCFGSEDAKLKIHIKDEQVACFQWSVSSFSTADSRSGEPRHNTDCRRQRSPVKLSRAKTQGLPRRWAD
jgi:hypothetical protein